VLDVPAKLAARVRLFDTGHNRKTDALDAHSIAIVAVRTPGLRVVAPDAELEALRMLTDRRDELARLRVQTVNRLQRLLGELIPGQRKKDLSALQAKAMLATVRPRDVAGKTRRRMAAEELGQVRPPTGPPPVSVERPRNRCSHDPVRGGAGSNYQRHVRKRSAA
jgi:transposase